MSAYEELEKRAKSSLGSGKYVQLKKDGDLVVGAFVGEPVGLELFWDGKKYVPYTEENQKRGEKVTFRVKHNFLVTHEGNGDDRKALDPPKVKILEMSATTFTGLMKAKKKYGLEGKYFEVQRSGNSGENNITTTIMVDADIPPEDKEMIKTLQLHNLEDGSGDDDDESFDSYDKDTKTDPDAPISKDELTDLVSTLKTVPKSDLQKFLSKFGIAKIKELKKKDLEAAQAFVAELKGEEKKETDEEEDPFA